MSNREDEKSDGVGLPLGLSFERWKFMVRALKQLNADRNPVTLEQLNSITQINANTLSNNIKFLKQIGILTDQSKSSSISLSENGVQYVETFIANNLEKEKEIFSKLIRTGLHEIISFCDLHTQGGSKLSFDMVFGQIKILSSTPDVQGQIRNTYPIYRAGINTVITMLIYLGILDPSLNPDENKTSAIKNGEYKPRKHSEIPINCAYEWMIKLFSSIKDKNPDIIETPFITANVIGSNHEASVLTLARFLGLIDSEGKHGENYEKLRFYGTEEFGNNLTAVIKEKYSKIFNVADLETIEKNNLVNLIMREYELGDDHTNKAISILTNLCSLSTIKVSENLLKPKKSVTKKEERKAIQESTKSTTTNDEKIQAIPLQPIHYDVSNGGLKIDINVNVDAKDKESFTNVLSFLENLKQMSNSTISKLDIKIQNESKEIEN